MNTEDLLTTLSKPLWMAFISEGEFISFNADSCVSTKHCNMVIPIPHDSSFERDLSTNDIAAAWIRACAKSEH